jgi:hypothetical protein
MGAGYFCYPARWGGKSAASTCRCGNHVGNGLPLAAVIVPYDLIFFTYPCFSGCGSHKKRHCIDSF